MSTMNRIRETNPGLEIFLEAQPENSYCADCSTRNPRWASVSLGIFLCTNCAGIHRKLGVHISFVQSVTIDRWKPEWIEKFSKMGNRVGKIYYEEGVTESIRSEYAVPAALTGGDSISESDARKLETWIRKKYETKEYALGGGAESVLPEPKVLVQQGIEPMEVYQSFIDSMRDPDPNFGSNSQQQTGGGPGPNHDYDPNSNTQPPQGPDSGGPQSQDFPDPNFVPPPPPKKKKKDKKRATYDDGTGPGQSSQQSASFDETQNNNIPGCQQDFFANMDANNVGGGGPQDFPDINTSGFPGVPNTSSSTVPPQFQPQTNNVNDPTSAGFPPNSTQQTNFESPSGQGPGQQQVPGFINVPGTAAQTGTSVTVEEINFNIPSDNLNINNAVTSSTTVFQNPVLNPDSLQRGGPNQGVNLVSSIARILSNPNNLAALNNILTQSQTSNPEINALLSQLLASALTNAAGAGGGGLGSGPSGPVLTASELADLATQQRLLSQLSTIDMEQLAAVFAIPVEVQSQQQQYTDAVTGKVITKEEKQKEEAERQKYLRQVVGPRKREEWIEMVKQQYPDHEGEIKRKQMAKKRAMRCISRGFSGRMDNSLESFSKLYTNHQMVVPFGLNVHKQTFENSLDEKSKIQKCTRATQTDESLLLMYVQEKLLKQANKLIQFKNGNMNSFSMGPIPGNVQSLGPGPPTEMNFRQNSTAIR